MNQDTKQRQQPLVTSAETYPMKAIKQTETPTPKANHTNLQQQKQKSTSVENHQNIVKLIMFVDHHDAPSFC